MSWLRCLLVGHPDSRDAAIRMGANGGFFKMWICARCGNSVTRWL